MWIRDSADMGLIREGKCSTLTSQLSDVDLRKACTDSIGSHKHKEDNGLRLTRIG